MQCGDGRGSTYACLVTAADEAAGDGGATAATAAATAAPTQEAPPSAAPPAPAAQLGTPALRGNKRCRVDDAHPGDADKRQRIDDAELQTAAAVNLDAEAQTLIDEAKSLQARGVPDYRVENEAGRCRAVCVYTGLTPSGMQRVHEFYCDDNVP